MRAFNEFASRNFMFLLPFLIFAKELPRHQRCCLFFLVDGFKPKKKVAEKYWKEWNNNGDACRCRSHGLDPHNATVISNYYASYPKSGLDGMLRCPKLLGLLLRGKMKKKFLSRLFLERCHDNISWLIGCTIEHFQTLIKLMTPNFVVRAV